MTDKQNRATMPRRQALARLGAGAGALLASSLPADALQSNRTQPIQLAGREVELVITPISDATVRISLLPIEYGRPIPVEESIVFPRDQWPEPAARIRTVAQQTVPWQERRIQV